MSNVLENMYLKEIEEAIANKQKELEYLKDQREKIVIRIKNSVAKPCNCKICRSGGLPY